MPTVDDLSLREQVGQTIMPRVLIGEQKAFKQAVLNGEVTGFFIKAKEGAVTQPQITAKNQARFIARQRKRLEKTIRDLNKWASKSPHKIPLLLAVDYEGGTVTSPMFMGLKQMPSNMLLAASGDEKVVADMYTAQAKEILLSGANTALGPVTDVNSNPLNPIIQTRSFGDNSADVGRFSGAASRALENNGVPSFIKHFPGHGDTSSDSHYEQPVTALPAEELWQAHISAFQPAITAGGTGVLSAHVVYPALDDENTASFSSKILKGLLREKMGFKGIIATDGLDMGAVKGVGVEEIVRRAYGAGNNLLLLSGDIRDVKSLSDRYTLLADRTLEILTEYWFQCGRPRGILFPSSWTGDYLTKDSVIQFFRESAERAGIQKHVSTHCLRHSFASHLFESGCDIKYIQALLGHRDPKSTEIYLHVSNKTLLGIKSPFDEMSGE